LDIPHLFFGIHNQNIRFVEPDPTDTNRRRWQTAGFWDRFIANADIVAVFIKPGGSYSSENLSSYILNSCGTSIAAFISLHGYEQLLTEIDRVKKTKQPNKKQEFILRERFGEDWERVFKAPSKRFNVG
jgi:hypothetical protein